MSGRGFDAFGKPRNETDLIHMNGRVYDYNLGRFLSVDPFIQFPANSQSMNAYSYIMNNPLSGADPSGYQTQPPDATMSGTGASSGGNSAMDQSEGFHVNPQGFSLNWRSIQVAPVNGVSAGGSSGDDMTSAEEKLTPESRSSQNNDDSIADDDSGNNAGDSSETTGLFRKANKPVPVTTMTSSKNGLFTGDDKGDLNVAAYDLGGDLNARSANTDGEYGVFFGRDMKGDVISGKPFRGHNGKITKNQLSQEIADFQMKYPNVTIVGVLHTHGCDVCRTAEINLYENFSSDKVKGADIEYLDGRNSLGRPLIGYLVTPRGRLLKYGPTGGSANVLQIGWVWSKPIPDRYLKNLDVVTKSKLPNRGGK